MLGLLGKDYLKRTTCEGLLVRDYREGLLGKDYLRGTIHEGLLRKPTCKTLSKKTTCKDHYRRNTRENLFIKDLLVRDSFRGTTHERLLTKDYYLPRLNKKKRRGSLIPPMFCLRDANRAGVFSQAPPRKTAFAYNGIPVVYRGNPAVKS